MAGLRKDIKGLLAGSAVYGIGSIAVRAVSFFLIPVFTRTLSKAEYGLLAAIVAVQSILGILMPASLPGAISRFDVDAKTDDEKRRVAGTLWLTMLSISLTVALLLDRFGEPILDALVHGVPFQPHLRMAIWVAFFAVLPQAPMALFQIREKPARYVLVSFGTALLGAALAVWFATAQKQGLLGWLRGYLYAGFITSPIVLWLTLREVRPVLLPQTALRGLKWSLPLVPHALAAWALELSDRLVLQRYVPDSQLGIYALATQYGSIMVMAGTSLNYAWIPFLYRAYAQDGEQSYPRVARAASVYAAGLLFIALALSLFAPHIVQLLASRAYQPAVALAPWVVIASLLNTLYALPVNLLFLHGRTTLIPIATLAGGAVKISVNLWLAPKIGILAGVWSGILGYGVMLLVTWSTAVHISRFPFDYRRLTICFGAAAVPFCAAMLLPRMNFWGDVTVKAGLLLIMPALLIGLGFHNAETSATLRTKLEARLRR
jgi:O-antigen/teichoic acid export membrane protein